MSFTSGWINFETTDEAQFVVVTAVSDADIVQCYVNDELVDHVAPDGQAVQLGVNSLPFRSYIRLLAVDTDSATVNFHSEAWPLDQGNRITVRTPTIPGWLPGELWRVFQDDTQIFEQIIWDLNQNSTAPLGCRGSSRGSPRGIETYGSGRGSWRGLQRGFEPITLLHETEVLSPATYEIAATTLDNAGNETVQVEEDVEVDTWPAEPFDLLVDSYNSGTGLLAFTWTESTDLD